MKNNYNKHATSTKLGEINIRNIVAADTVYLKQYLNSPSVLRWFPMSNTKEIEDSVNVWQTFARRGSAFAIEKNYTPLGFSLTYINHYAKLKHQALFAIIVGEPYQNQGIGSLLLQYVIQTAKDDFNLEILHLEVYEHNPAYRLYTRFGFKEFGRHEKFLKEKDGSYHTKISMQLDLTTL